ncbi:ABC-2 family transporter protein [Pseudoclostridium thermosuccinogenes]
MYRWGQGNEPIPSWHLQKWIARFFTFVIPFGCMNYYPLMYVLDRVEGNEILYMLSPLCGILFVFPCFLVWGIGVRHYRSTGS